MQKLSISFTLGKASVPHETNVEHNNREFIAKNVHAEKVSENITYVKQNVEDAYEKLFSKSVEQYNSKQTRKDRMISNYFEHISKSKREEAFYEIIVQFGDNQTAPCGSQTGEIAKQMLDEYIKTFQERNPNLHVFNAVLHMDEASPHLHIDFIPFYTEKSCRQNGLSKGVSMKSALDEQGFKASNYKANRLVAWEESERNFMEKILNEHNFAREDKGATYQHMSVEKYKRTQDEKKIVMKLKAIKSVSADEISKENVVALKSKLASLEHENQNLTEQKNSPYKSFFYSSSEKQAFVQSKLDELKIPYRETENGFEAQEYFIDKIREIEKEFIPAKGSNNRQKLISDIDRLLMQSESFEQLLEKLKQEGYEVKQGKYIAVKPQSAKNFIRLKSLGESYNEYALRNRIATKQKFENRISEKLDSIQNKNSLGLRSFEYFFFRTVKIYTVNFKRGLLPVKKKNPKKHFAWNNDIELDRLLILNKKIDNNATLESLKKDFENAEQVVKEQENILENLQSNLKVFTELKEKLEVIFEGKTSENFTKQQAFEVLDKHPNINQNNYKNVENLIADEQQNLQKAQSELDKSKQDLKEKAEIFSLAEKIFGGTYVQELVQIERQKRELENKQNNIKK